MALSAKLELRQGQQLVMTPQLQQAIRLLQLSNLELTEFVDAELERNPLLEREETTSSAKPADEPQADRAEEPTGDGADDRWLDLTQPVSDHTGGLDADFGNVFQEPSTGEPAGGPAMSGMSWANVTQRMHNGGNGDNDLEDFVAHQLSLREHLSAQLPLTVTEPVERLIGQHLIDLVDDAGYIPADLEALSQRLGAPLELVESVLGKLQTFDPPGIFARSLAECLALQLKDQNRYDPLMAQLLANLDLLANRNIGALKKAVGVDMDELAEMIREIKHLNPKPGLKFGSVQMQPVVPDVIVRAASDGGWHVELNSDTLPRVLINRTYYTRIAKTATSEKDKGYLFECLQTANWLVKSLDQRARTILKVAEQIVRQQDSFLHVRRSASAAAQLEGDCGRHLDARIDRVARDVEQVHRDPARHLRTQIFLHLGNRVRGRRGSAFVRVGPLPHQADDRCRACRRCVVRRSTRRQAQKPGRRHRAAHSRQVPGSDAHTLFRAAPAR